MLTDKDRTARYSLNRLTVLSLEQARSDTQHRLSTWSGVSHKRWKFTAPGVARAPESRISVRQATEANQGGRQQY